jgi:hypothetical protein
VDDTDAEVLRTTQSAKNYAPAEAHAFEQRQRELAQASGQHEEHAEFNAARFHRKILRWLVMDQQPFLAAESKALEEAFSEARHSIHLNSRTTYHRLLMEVFEEERQKVRALLATHTGLFNFTCDAWSDIQQREFLGQFIHDSFRVCWKKP